MSEMREEPPIETPIWSIDDPNAELGLLLRLENAAATEKFEEVLEVAIDTCLRDRRVYEASLSAVESTSQRLENQEHELVSKLGLWGLKANIDFAEHSYTFYRKPLEGLPAPLLHDVLGDPATVPLSPDIIVQNKIEAFGTAIIHEAFDCLGEDAHEKAEAFAAADTEEQIQILKWLYDRIKTIQGATDSDDEDTTSVPPQAEVAEPRVGELVTVEPGQISAEREVIDFSNSTLDEVREVVDEMLGIQRSALFDYEPDADGRYFYHPVRLSPKAIGRYPENGVRTTCLGVSVLTAAFLNRANAKYMHAGVMETGLEAARMTQMHTILSVEEFMAENGITPIDTAAEVMESIEASIDKMRRTDRGHHAICMVELNDGSWVLFDPNYNAQYHLDKGQETDRITQLYEKLELTGMANQASSQMIDIISGNFCDFYFGMADTLMEKLPEDIAETVDAMMASENLVDAYKDYIIASIADLKWIDMLVDFHTYVTTGDKEKCVDYILDMVISKYALLKDMTPEAIQQRYHTDAGFRQRRIEDAAMLPIVTIMVLESQYAELHRTGHMHSPPSLLETGLPEYRIGACVLSDFAIYTGNEVPLSFWVANWPSHVAVEAHLPADNDDSVQAELARRMSSIVRSGNLRHFTSYGIINRFLEQGENSTNGN